MASKELRRMNRTELIEIIYALEQNEQKLQEENDKLTAEMEDRKIRMDESGSIAEAALSLNHIFEDAQAAADQYLLSLQSREEEEQPEPEQTAAELGGPEENLSEEEGLETGARETDPGSEKILEDARRQADQILEDAGQQGQDILEEARKQADGLVEEALKKANEITDEAYRQADVITGEARQKADEYLAAASEDVDADAAREIEQTRQQCEKERQAVQEYHDKFLQDMSDVLKDDPELLERVRQMGSVEGEE